MNKDTLLLERQLCFKLYQASRKMTRLYQPFLDEIGLTYPQYLTMMVVWEEKVIDFKDLSLRLDLKTGTLTPIVQKLEKLGYLLRVSNPKDKRRVDIQMTDLGEALKVAASKVPESMAIQLNMDMESYLKYYDFLEELGEKLNEAEQKKKG